MKIVRVWCSTLWGAVVAGVVAIVVGMAVWDAGRDGVLPAWGYAWLTVTCALLLGMAGAKARVLLFPHPARRDRRWADVRVAGAGWHVSATLAAAATAVYLVRHVRQEIEAGLPGPMPALLAAGGVVVAVGLGLTAVLDILTALDVTVPRPGQVAVTCLVGAMVAGVLMAPAPVVVPLRAVTATTAEAVDDPAAVPETVTDVAWRWQTPDGNRVQDLVRGGPGAIVLLDDGVVALDGATGEERWRYRGAGLRAREMFASPGGTAVAVTFVPDGDAERRKLVVLDAETGEVGYERFDHVHPFSNRLDRFFGLTSASAVSWYGQDRIGAHDRHTGRETWSWSAPEECVAVAENPSAPADQAVDDASNWAIGDVGRAADAVVVAVLCADAEPFRSGDPTTDDDLPTVGLVALDDHDGAELWRRELWRTESAGDDMTSDRPRVPRVDVSEEGDVVTVCCDDDDRVHAVAVADGDLLVTTPRDTHGMGDRDRRWNGYGADRYLRNPTYDWEAVDEPLEYSWVPYGDEDTWTVTLEEYCVVDESVIPVGRALPEVLLAACQRDFPQHDDGMVEVGFEVAAAPWGFADVPETLDVELAVDAAAWRFWPRGTSPLCPVPGAVVLTLPGATEVIGLA